MSLKKIENILKSTENLTPATRRAFLKEFQEILDPKVSKEIENNTKNNIPGLVNWHYIFQTSHKILLLEAEKYANNKKETKTPSEIPKSAFTLLKSTIHVAINYLKASELVSSILQVFKEKKYVCLCTTYLSILMKYVLSNKHHILSLNYEKWQALLENSVNLYQQKNDLNKLQILSAIQIIVRVGSSQSQLIHDMKKLLPFLVEILKKIKNLDTDHVSKIFELTITICEEISSESRIAICKFGESVLPDLLKLENIPKYTDKYKLILILIRVHHPKGKQLFDHGTTYIFDTDKWRTIVYQMADLVFAESDSKNDSENFTKFACEVFKQTIEISKTSTSPPRSKKPHLTGSSVLEIISNHGTKMNFAAILSLLLNKYPECLEKQDYLQFLKTLTDCFAHPITEKNAQKMFNDFCGLAISLMKIEKILFKKGYCKDAEKYWDKIWDEILKHIAQNSEEETYYELVSNFIIYGKMYSPYEYLKLYYTQLINWTPKSVRTLLLFCQHVPLPKENLDLYVSAKNDKLTISSRILDWICDVPWWKTDHTFPIDEFAELVVGLYFESFRKQIKEDIRKNDYKSSKIGPIPEEVLETCYLSLEFESKYSDSKKICSTSQINIPISQKESDCINRLLAHCNTFFNDEDDLKTIVLKTALLIKIASIGSSLNEMSKLVLIIQSRLKIIESKILCDEFSSNKFTEIAKIVHLFRFLYMAANCEVVTKVVISEMKTELLQKLQNLSELSSQFQNLQNEDAENDENINFENFDLKVETAKFFMTFCCLNIKNGITDIQTEFLKQLFEHENQFFEQESQIVKIFLDIFRKNQPGIFQIKVINAAINLCIRFYEVTHRTENAIVWLLQILPQLFNHANYMGCDIGDILQLFMNCYNHLSTKHYGLAANFAFANCFGEFTKLEPTFVILTETDNRTGKRISMEDILLSLMNSSLFLIRLLSAQFVRKIFSSIQISYVWKSAFYEKLKSTVMPHFNVLPETEPDERAARITSATYTIAAPISKNSYFQTEAVFILLSTQVEKCINPQSIKKVLCLFSREKSSHRLISNILKSLLYRWYIVGKLPLNNFPFFLNCCSSLTEFYSKTKKIIFPIIIENAALAEVAEFCSMATLELPQMLEECFTIIIPWLLNESASAKQILKNLRKNEVQFQEIVLANLESILLELFGRFHDGEKFREDFEMEAIMAREETLSLNLENWRRCLEILERKWLKLRKGIVEFLVEETPDVIQKILLRLVNRIYSSIFLEEKLIRLHQYTLFVSLIIKNLKRPIFNNFSTFLIRTIGFDLLHLINDSELLLAESSCKYLAIFVRKVLSQRPKSIQLILSYCVKSLIRLTSRSTSFIAPNLLRFLILEISDTLRDEIAKLEAFPENPIFEDVQAIWKEIKGEKNLEHEIRMFLENNDGVFASYSIESLEHLQKELRKRKMELCRLQRMWNSSEFEECEQTNLIRLLIYELINLTDNSDVNISLKSAKCLGQIGPIPLPSKTLYISSHEKNLADDISTLTYKICRFLTDGLTAQKQEVRVVSATALYAVCNSAWGRKFLNEECVKTFESTLNVQKGNLRLDFIKPFLVPSEKDVYELSVSVAILKQCFDPDCAIWRINSRDSHEKWVVEVTRRIAECIQKSYLRELEPVFRLNPQFCEKILPDILSVLLLTNENISEEICRGLNSFFVKQFGEYGAATQCSTRSAKVMLNILRQIRIKVDPSHRLNLDFAAVTHTAQFTQAHFSAVYYAEIACDEIIMENWSDGRMRQLNDIHKIDVNKGRELQCIIRDEFSKIGDPDLIHSCRLLHVDEPSVLAKSYLDTKNWSKLILTEDKNMKCGHFSARNLMYGLQQYGMDWTAGHLVSYQNPEAEKVRDLQYEALWRLADWKVVEDFYYDRNYENSYFSNDYFSYHYQALKNLAKCIEEEIDPFLEKAWLSVFTDLKNISLESFKTIYLKLTQLKTLCEFEDFTLAQKEGNFEALFREWKEIDITKNYEFADAEPILAQRVLLCGISNSLEVLKNKRESLVRIMEIAKKKGYFKKATQILDIITMQNDNSLEEKSYLEYKEAQLAYSQHENQRALFLLRKLISREAISPELKAKTFILYGSCVAELRLENSKSIKNYYQKALDIFKSIENPSESLCKSRNNAHVILAKFADSQYKQLVEYMSSPQFLTFKKYVMNSNTLQSSSDPDTVRAINIFKKQNANDLTKMQNFDDEKQENMILAFECYLKVLQHCDNYDYLISRIITLWLDNKLQKETNDLFNKYLEIIPSYKFVPLLPQLAPHLSNISTIFTKKVECILKKCALEHPYHTLPSLLALKNHKDDFEFFSDVDTLADITEPRVYGARNLINKLMKTPIAKIIIESNQVAHALINLAYYDIGNRIKRNVQFNIPQTHDLLKIRNFEFAAVPTIDLKVRKNCDYSSAIVGVKEYCTNFRTVGGVNTPKLIVCVGTDGVQRKQLVKGRDDMRQDAIMQQVFTEVNYILKKNKETKQRNLKIRTYKIVPLTQRSGILEWCENTSPIVSLLVGADYVSGLHKKYFPNDYTAIMCKEKLSSATESEDAKLQEFLDCCKHLHPVFHYFFFENYLLPEIWFEKRVTYTRSVATTSIIGYIVGLGDRHLNNILLDKSTAEVIHIDFGIAFDQGSTLTIPETVPFRLTRDIESAMGITAIDGLLKRSCEETMKVLREQRDEILMLLEVLLYNPLFSWVISSDTALNTVDSSSNFLDQNDDDNLNDTNKQAKRALLHVKQRLQGIDGGIVMSVRGQVERLIKQARDPFNLCRIYPGWQPYL